MKTKAAKSVKKVPLSKMLKTAPKVSPKKKASENVGPLGFKTHQRPEDRPRNV